MNSSVTELRSLSAIQETAADWYARRLGSELTDDEERELGRWLAADPRHHREYHAMEALWEGASAVAETPAISQLRAEAAEQQKPEKPRHAGWIGGWRFARPAIAASVALATVLIGALLVFNAPEPRQFATTQGQQKSVVLADGTLVELDAKTQLTVAYTPTARRVILDSGQAHFAVYKDPGRPFEVESGNSLVRAIGTAFQVYRRGDSVTITLLEGRVEVSAVEASQRAIVSVASELAWHHRLEPGEQIIVREAEPKAPQVAKVDIDRVTAWRRGTLDFDALPLPEVVAEINRYSTRLIRIADPALNEVTVSGIFAIGDTETILLALETGFDIDARPRSGRGDIYLYAKSRH